MVWFWRFSVVVDGIASKNNASWGSQGESIRDHVCLTVWRDSGNDFLDPPARFSSEAVHECCVVIHDELSCICDDHASGINVDRESGMIINHCESSMIMHHRASRIMIHYGSSCITQDDLSPATMGSVLSGLGVPLNKDKR